MTQSPVFGSRPEVHLRTENWDAADQACRRLPIGWQRGRSLSCFKCLDDSKVGIGGALGYSLPAAYHHFLVDLVCIIVYPLCEDIPK